MQVPPTYLQHTLELLRPLCAAKGTMAVKQVQAALGKAARIGCIMPECSPFIPSLWGGYAAGCRQAEEERPGTSKHRLPVKRFSVSANWYSEPVH